MTDRTLQPEILVVGAGPGGAVTAWTLAQAGHDVLMIDRADFPRDKTCGDGLTPMAVRTMKDIGVLDQIKLANPAYIEQVRLVGPFGGEFIAALSDFNEPGADYALVLPRVTLDDLLRQHAIEGGAEFASSIRIDSIQREGDRIVSVSGTSPDGPVSIRPRHVVLAVGANMGLLERAGFLHSKRRLIRAARGYYTGVKIPANRYDFYYDLELLPGYGWIFPTGDGRANVGAGVMDVFWSSRRGTQGFVNEFVQRRVKHGVMAHAEPDGTLKGFPLRIDFPNERIAGENWILVGEATGLVNPLSGEGIDLAMESGAIAGRLLHEDIVGGRGDHISYQRELWYRFAPLFNGIRALRDILITPLMMDYVIWQMNHQKFLSHTAARIVQGIGAPQNVFHPLFILQFFMPISPKVGVDLARQLFNPRQRRSNRPQSTARR